jgi:protein involved in polysaccharide export with SLBB domain
MRRITSLVLLLAMLLPGSGWAQATTAATERAPLTLQPGDAIRVHVYQDNVTGEYIINEEGVVTLPLLGERRVIGIPVRELRQQLLADYRRFLNNPGITITPLRRISVLGSVVRPGILSVDPTFTLADAIALAGGANTEGDITRVKIVRSGRVIEERAFVGEVMEDAGIRSGDQILVGRRSWFDRNSTFIVSALLSVASIASSIIITR